MQVARAVQFPPGGGDPGAGQGRGGGHPVHSNELVQVQAGQCGDVPYGCLEGPEWSQWGSLVRGPGAGDVGQVGELGCLVHDVPGGRKVPVVEEGGDFEELQGDVDAPVDRVGVAEDRAGEHGEPVAVVCGVVLQVGFQAEPELEALVECGRLWGCVGVVEGVFVRLGSFLAGVAPDGRGSSDRLPLSVIALSVTWSTSSTWVSVLFPVSALARPALPMRMRPLTDPTARDFLKMFCMFLPPISLGFWGHRRFEGTPARGRVPSSLGGLNLRRSKTADGRLSRAPLGNQ